MEGIKGALGPRELFRFDDPSSIDDCKPLSDRDIGGFSTVHLDWVPHPPSSLAPPPSLPPSPPPPPRDPRIPPVPKPKGYVRVRGVISTRLPPDRPDVIRSGYAGFRTRDRPPTIFGRGLWDLDPYVYLGLRVRMPGPFGGSPRGWYVNVQTDGVVSTDLHQHRLWLSEDAGGGRRGLAVPEEGVWQTVLIKMNEFVRTNHGLPVEPATGMLKQRVKSVGLGLTDRVEGPYELHVERVWATNLRGDEEVRRAREEEREWAEREIRELEGADAVKGGNGEGSRDGVLRDKNGRRIAWGDIDK